MKKHLPLILLAVCTIGSLNADWFSKQWESVEKPLRNIVVRPVGDVAPKDTPKVIKLQNRLDKVSKQIAEAQRQNKINQLKKLQTQKMRIKKQLSEFGF